MQKKNNIYKELGIYLSLIIYRLRVLRVKDMQYHVFKIHNTDYDIEIM